MHWTLKVVFVTAAMGIGAPVIARPAGALASEDMPVTTRSDEARRLYLEGRRYIDSWRLAKARPLFEKALELDPDFALGTVGLAWSQPRLKDMWTLGEKARGMLARVDVTEAERLYVEGFYASLNADGPTWAETAGKIAEMYPGGIRAQFHYGVALLWGMSDYEAARVQLEKATRIDPDFGPAHGYLGRTYVMLGNDSAAKKSYLRYLELDPDDPRAHNDYAELMLKGGHYAEAVTSFRRALELESTYEASHMGVATALMLQGKHDEARAHLLSFYEVAPNDGVRSGLHFALAVVSVDEGRTHDAVHELEANYRLSRKIGDSIAMRLDRHNTAAILSEEGFFEEAREMYDEALALELAADHSPRYKNARRAMHHYLLGTVAVEEGALTEAAQEADQYEAMLASVDDPVYIKRGHDLRGRIALAGKEYGAALDEFSKAFPEESYTMYRMAQAFDGMGRRDKVVEMLRYVVNYRGILNLNYALVRHKAAAWLARLETTPEIALASDVADRRNELTFPEEARKRLDDAIGKWRSETRYLDENGNVTRTNVSEDERRFVIDDRVIEISGRVLGEGGASFRAWEYYDVRNGKYTLTSIDRDGSLWTLQGELGDEFVWTSDPKPMPDGTTLALRFTHYDFTADSFTAIGEKSRDGGRTWRVFTKQFLTRTGTVDGK